MKDEGFCAYPISKKRFDEFLEREILCRKILPEQPSLIYKDDSQAFVPFSKNIITFLCMAYYPERMQIIMFVGYREKSRNCSAFRKRVATYRNCIFRSDAVTF